MKISTRGRYALRMLVDIAENQDRGFVSLKDISERQGISKKYLEQIVSLLNSAGMLKAGRGFQGGYKLSKDYPVDREYMYLLDNHRDGDTEECNDYLKSKKIAKRHQLGIIEREK